MSGKVENLDSFPDFMIMKAAQDPKIMNQSPQVGILSWAEHVTSLLSMFWVERPFLGFLIGLLWQHSFRREESFRLHLDLELSFSFLYRRFLWEDRFLFGLSRCRSSATASPILNCIRQLLILAHLSSWPCGRCQLLTAMRSFRFLFHGFDFYQECTIKNALA